MALRARHFPLVCLLLAAAGVTGAGTGTAWAGAWLMPPGHGQAIVYSAFSDSNRAFDDEGHLIPVPDYKKFELGTYIEYGVANWLTLVASPAYDRISNPPPGQSYNGLGESELAARPDLNSKTGLALVSHWFYGCEAGILAKCSATRAYFVSLI